MAWIVVMLLLLQQHPRIFFASHGLHIDYSMMRFVLHSKAKPKISVGEFYNILVDLLRSDPEKSRTILINHLYHDILAFVSCCSFFTIYTVSQCTLLLLLDQCFAFWYIFQQLLLQYWVKNLENALYSEVSAPIVIILWQLAKDNI